MRVLFLHNDYLLAGGERYSVAAEVAALREHSDVAVSECIVTNEELQGGGLTAFRTVMSRQESFNLVSDALAREKPDLVHVQNLFPRLGAGAIQALHSARVPYVRSLRNYRLRCIAATCFLNGTNCLRCVDAAHGFAGVAHGCYRSSRPASAGAMLYAIAESRSAAKYPPRAYILLSSGMKRMLQGVLGGIPTFVKPNPVEGPPFDVPVPRHTRAVDVIFAGRLSVEKRVDSVVDLARRMHNNTFRIIGDGPLRGMVDDAVPMLPNLSYVPAVSQADALVELSQARVAVVPSSWEEPFGRVAAEALAVGTPPVVANRGGLPDVVRDVDRSLVVERDSKDSWCDQVRAVLEADDSTYDRLVRRSLRRWRLAYSPNENAKALRAIYEAALSL